MTMTYRLVYFYGFLYLISGVVFQIVGIPTGLHLTVAGSILMSLGCIAETLAKGLPPQKEPHGRQ